MNEGIKRFPYHIFEVTGIEMEYMIVDKTTLSVKPLCDKLMEKVAGHIVSYFDNGPVMWSNELVNHLVEIKTNGPVRLIYDVMLPLIDNVNKINALLEPFNAMLMPGGTHPWMDPFTETVLWQFENNEIYDRYNSIFDCRGHGWSNLQSTHVNLPFGTIEEFGRLHAAVRILLPVLPALCASSPILDGNHNGFLDHRLETYRLNQKKIPVISGKVIPEQAFTEDEYYCKIFNPIMAAIQPYNQDGILVHHFLNSRGAIARFDRSAIEIRIIDNQECPLADLAIAEGINAVLKIIVDELFTSFEEQKSWHEDDLSEIFLDCIRSAENTVIKNSEYLKLFGVYEKDINAGKLWKHLLKVIEPNMNKDLWPVLKEIIENGSLSTRIMARLNGDYSKEKLRQTYGDLSDCLQNNRLFNCTS